MVSSWKIILKATGDVLIIEDDIEATYAKPKKKFDEKQFDENIPF
jgi:hypothetical protein